MIKKPAIQRQRVLVAQPYGIGDALFMLPLLKALKQQAEVERIDVILGSRTKEIMRCSSYIDDIYVIDKDIWKAQGKLRTLIDKLGLFMQLRKRRYDIFIDLSMQPEYGLWAKVLGISVRAGFDYKNRGRFLNRRLTLSKEGFVCKHMIEYYADIGRLLGVEIIDRKPELQLTPDSLIQAKTILDNNGMAQRRYIILAPGGGATWGAGARLRLWPVEHFVGLLELLKAKISFDGVIVIGASDDRALGEEIKKKWSGRTINCCGMTNLVTSAALTRMSQCFIGSDSGIVHLATALDVPIITFYGAPDPRVYGPHPLQTKVAALTRSIPCRPCYKGFRYSTNCSDVSCLSGLTAANVISKLEKIDFFKNFL